MNGGEVQFRQRTPVTLFDIERAPEEIAAAFGLLAQVFAKACLLGLVEASEGLVEIAVEIRQVALLIAATDLIQGELGDLVLAGLHLLAQGAKIGQLRTLVD